MSTLEELLAQRRYLELRHQADLEFLQNTIQQHQQEIQDLKYRISYTPEMKAEMAKVKNMVIQTSQQKIEELTQVYQSGVQKLEAQIEAVRGSRDKKEPESDDKISLE